MLCDSFHTIYWPAFLLALEIPLPRQVLTHAHWTLGRSKMSKSTGNVVNPFFALQRFGVDPLRFYLAHDGGISQDADYGNEYIVERYRKGLQGGLGNLASRVLRGKRWSVTRSVQRFHAGELSNVTSWPKAEQDMWTMLSEMPAKVTTRYDALDVSSACKKTLQLVYATNAYLQTAAPWTAKRMSQTETASTPFDDSVSDLTEVDRTIFLCAESMRLIGIMLSPVMPEKMTKLLDMLGARKDRRTWQWCVAGKDDTFGQVEEGVTLGKGTGGVLFPPLEDA
jgi:methionyl-tRNA synthetase